MGERALSHYRDQRRPSRHGCDHVSPSHVAVVTETYPPEVNGVALTLARLTSGLRARGYRVSLVRPRRRGDGADPNTTLTAGLPLPGYRGLRFGLAGARNLRAVWAAHRPDVVYVATEGPLGLAAVRAACALGVPVVSGFHTNFHNYVAHYGAGWLERPVTAYLRRFHNRTAATLVASDELRAALHAGGFRNLRLLGRGVDSALFPPARRSAALRATWGAGDHDVVVAYVGRIAPEKNIDLAIEAYRAMQSVQRARCFVAVGDGPARERLARAHPDVVFAGVRRGEELAAHYASADVFLFPSETETFGTVTLEALAIGLGVVAYDYAAAREHITHDVDGLLVPYRDTRAFVAHAMRLVCAPALLRRLRTAARATALPLDWPRIVDRFEAVLLSVAVARSSDVTLSGSQPMAIT
jgi:glycosyltransferase involved in cell wall biosynthesis